ncbi:ROK family glucokinase [Aquibacillus koreensis]|uniref:Glucokinase n=1 Tax=Aquibacillus koreensis TaxID=279446 RepID=A0A9X4AIG9_9BACI|nr:ROK family glucokinase [Aquibacillus koreensis]MCT2536532.1 ROK family glucokinase [Aquibacillus koreensis]MDC3419380.1 ROK family glucokinase [Aquibacillus koreensis]
MKKLLGIDLGGTTVKFAILTEEGELQQQWNIDTDISEEGNNIVPTILDSIKERFNLYGLSSEDFLGIGMGSPGSVDIENGTVIGAYNLNWRTLQPVKQQMEAALGIPFFLDNDANVAALGEQWKGAGDGNSNVVLITLGTGVGGGIVSEGNLVHGISAAGEVGHLNVDPTGYACTCGNVGCLETVASATGVVRLAKDFAEEYAGDSELKALIDDGQEVTAKTVFDQAKAEDPLAKIVVDKFYFYLGLASANIANILHPNTIVIGGGVSAAGEMLIKGVEAYFQKYAFPPIKTTTKIKLAELGNTAGVIGAASLVKLYS